MMKYFAAALLALAPAGCMHSVRVAPIQLEPIRVTMDVNVRVDPAAEVGADPDPGPATRSAGAERGAGDPPAAQR